MGNNATFTFALPEDTDSNYLQLWSATTETGTYSQVGSDIAYSYGETTYEYTSLSTTTWYKIRFYNSTEGNYGPYSEPVYGGNWSTSTNPFLSVSTTTDGANYATIQEVRDFSGLNSDMVTDDRVSQCLRRARAIVDIKTSDMGIDRFANFASDIARKKYNASLRLVKEAEINYSLGMIYRGMIDDIIISGLNSTSLPANISIGTTTLNLESSAKNSNSYRQLEKLSVMYTQRATVLLSIIQPSTINVSWKDPQANNMSPKFLWPDSLRGRY